MPRAMPAESIAQPRGGQPMVRTKRVTSVGARALCSEVIRGMGSKGGPMGLFDELLRNTIGSQASDPSSQSRSLLGGLVSMLEDPSVGGVDGLVRQFEQHGLGGEAKSWIGTGANRAITPDQLSRALGPQRVESL